jgi:putative transcription factor
LQCEVCGCKIFGEPVRSIIEGAKMIVCNKCGKLGSGYWNPKPQIRKRYSINSQPIQPYAKKKKSIVVSEEYEIVTDVGNIVRQARNRINLSHEDLGRKIREKVSVLRKIENGKMIPDLGLAERLEHALKITLRVPVSEPQVQGISSAKPRETTLGDLIQLKKKEAN